MHEAKADDQQWCASALARAEALGMVERVCDVPADGDRIRRALTDDWERIHVVPVDQLCLDRATELTRTHPLRTVDEPPMDELTLRRLKKRRLLLRDLIAHPGRRN